MLIQKLLMMTWFLFSLSIKNYAQTNLEKPAVNKDSMLILKEVADTSGKEVEDTSEEEEASSYFTIELGLSDRVFNVHNRGLSNKVSSVKTLVLSPSLVYHHKTGFYFSAATDLLNNAEKGFGASQYYISTGYDLPGNENIDLSFAYTHYFGDDHFSTYVSPVQNDFYSSVTYKKTWIRPGFSAGYSTGTYGEVKRLGNLYDSITNHIESFSASVSASHAFNWVKIFSKEDVIAFTPSLMLNFFKGNTAIDHNSNSNLVNFLNKRGRLPKFDNSAFNTESIGVNLDASYEIGKFTIEPQAYFDYYLPATEDKRLSVFVTLNIKYSLQ